MNNMQSLLAPIFCIDEDKTTTLTKKIGIVMGIGRFFKSLVNSEVMAEEIIKSIIQLYEETARYNPGDSSQELLVKTYLSRLRARGIDIEDERVVLNAMSETMLLSQLPEGQSIKALALTCLFKERPDIIGAYPKFAAEYERLMTPILEPANVDNSDMTASADDNQHDFTGPDTEKAETTSEVETTRGPEVSPKDGGMVSNHEITVTYLKEFVLESKTARLSIMTKEQMIDTLSKLPQFSRLPTKYQAEVLSVVEEAYPEPLTDEDESQFESDSDDSNWAVTHYGEGSTYEGASVDGQPEGWGRLMLDDGESYEGEWKRGKYHGTGTLEWASGQRYEGEWEADEMNGYGTLTSAEGSSYEGEFQRGVQSGQGTANFSDGSSYVGEWERNELNGTGTYIWPDGTRYDGEYRNSERNGRGTLATPDGQTYEGQYKNDEKNGEGILTLPSGQRYEGEWKNGKRNGKGTLTWPDGRQYEGEWSNDEYHGSGTFIWASGHRYEGEWKNNQRHGVGTHTWPDGRQ